MSDTTRTDRLLTDILDAYGYVHQGNCPQRWVNHSRELERELNAANSRIELLMSANADVARIAGERDAAEKRIRLLIGKLDKYQARIQRLEEAGDALKAAGYFGGWADAVNKWIKVKEDKP